MKKKLCGKCENVHAIGNHSHCYECCFTVNRLFVDTSDNSVPKLYGLRNTFIYTTFHAFINMSERFDKECRIRNITVMAIAAL